MNNTERSEANCAFVRQLVSRKEPELVFELVLINAEFSPVLTTVGFGDLDFEHGAILPAYGGWDEDVQ